MRPTVTPERRLAALAEFSAECALAKIYGSEAYNRNADEAVQVFGGYGFSEEYPPAKMYRDSRIARIYEGTNEISRLYAQRTILKKLGAGEGYAGAGGGPMEDLKRLYFSLVEATVVRLGPEGMKDPNHQQFMASLADIAMEIFAAESVALRVAKLEGEGDRDEGEIRGDLATLVFQLSLERIRSEARAIVSELHRGDDLRVRLQDMDALLPAPEAVVETRNRVSDWVVGRGGRLPGGID